MLRASQAVVTAVNKLLEHVAFLSYKSFWRWTAFQAIHTTHFSDAQGYKFYTSTLCCGLRLTTPAPHGAAEMFAAATNVQL
jgi:hypothetical protein